MITCLKIDKPSYAFDIVEVNLELCAENRRSLEDTAVLVVTISAICRTLSLPVKVDNRIQCILAHYVHKRSGELE